MQQRRRAFSLIEIMTVALVVGVITAIAVPQISAKVLEREEQRAADQVSQWFEQVRNMARRERECFRVLIRQPGTVDGLLLVRRAECGTGVFIDGTPVSVRPLALNTKIIKKVLVGPNEYYGYDVVFNPAGGLDRLTCGYDGQRQIEVRYRSLRQATTVITPAVGGLRRIS